MNRLPIITLAGAIAMMLAFGIGISSASGPCTEGQDYGRAQATGPSPPQNRSNSFGDGWNIERGMMGPGWRNGTGAAMPGVYPWESPPYRRFDKPLDKMEALVLVQNYVDSTNNPNLKLGQETDNATGYELDIVTKDNSLVDRLLVNKDNAEIHSAY